MRGVPVVVAVSNTLVNVLTTGRLLLAVVLFVLIPCKWYGTAAGLFVVAAATDWVDGWYARRYGQVTKFGRIFDPFVDKVIVCGTYVFLAAEPGSGIAAWMAVVVMGRELLVTALRSFIEQEGGDFSAQWSGKLKMAVQCVAAVASLLALYHQVTWAGQPLPTWLAWGLPVAAWAAVAITVYSGVEYLWAASRWFAEGR
jgi:CDP-diacylglycerol--glycerol-3-phosphate 3-phosphatidyltransferase